jgi:hypothetical protein
MSSTTYQYLPLSPPDTKVIFPDMCWDKMVGTLYAAKLDGQIAVYDKRTIQSIFGNIS